MDLPGPSLDVAPVHADAVRDQAWPFVRWLVGSRPVLDPRGLAAAARQQAIRMIKTKTDGSASPTRQQTTRSFVTRDLRVNEAMLARVGDPAMRVALGMRQLHRFVAAVQAWFTARDLHREGWKKDLTRLATVDPELFELVEQWLDANDVATRHAIFTEVAGRALEPIGGPLPPGSVLRGPDDVWEALDSG